jgi:hypothetical protein
MAYHETNLQRSSNSLELEEPFSTRLADIIVRLGSLYSLNQARIKQDELTCLLSITAFVKTSSIRSVINISCTSSAKYTNAVRLSWVLANDGGQKSEMHYHRFRMAIGRY